MNLTANTFTALAQELGDVLMLQNKKVTCAESCTGGALASTITDIAGSSAYFEQSWVTYSNIAKQEMVGVSPDTLHKFGAVSSEVVVEMAQGALSHSHADISVAISGIAGPDGGTATKPVGLVWFCIADNHGQRSFSRCFSGDRQQVRSQAVQLALKELIARLVTA